ncbi:MAG: sodium/proline symporter [Spirochaetes bacterium]|nr:sodium/proline symporter [Spirochaetota bacterium]
MNTVIITFLLFLSMFILIGVASTLMSRKTKEDYLVASRDIHPWLGAVSAAATNTSGYMFIGLIGFTYTFGISSIWVTVGWITGDYFLWRLMYRRMREETEKVGAHTVSSFLGYSKKHGVDRVIKGMAGVITLVFLATYASAQFTAGGKALHVLFDWNYSTGSIIGASIVLIYCFSGGLRASIWTDAAQATVMIVSMTVLLVISAVHVGSPVSLFRQLAEIDPVLVNLFPDRLAFGVGLYVLGWFAAGIGVAGEPDMAIRIMSISSPRHIGRGRRAYFGWYIPFSIASVLVGLYSRVLLPDVKSFDPELALPTLSMQMLPEVFVGLILAGLFAATMSTADSQVLSSGAALTQDIFPGLGRTRRNTKIGTLVIVSFSLAFAIYGQGRQNVFEIVTIAWSGLGASLGPLMILRSFGKEIGRKTAVAMMIAGVSVVLVWRYRLELFGSVYEILPGLVTAFFIYFISRLLKKREDDGEA